MIKAIIIAGIAFAIGNIIWNKFGMTDPKLFYVPLAAFLLLMILYVKRTISVRDKITHLLMSYLVLLAAGNFIKQLFYSENVKQLNDIWWGGLISLWLIVNLLIKTRWEIRKQPTKGKN